MTQFLRPTRVALTALAVLVLLSIAWVLFGSTLVGLLLAFRSR